MSAELLAIVRLLLCADSDKQNAINLFLGMFEPTDGQANIWELTTDFYLHNRPTLGADLGRCRRSSIELDTIVNLS